MTENNRNTQKRAKNADPRNGVRSTNVIRRKKKRTVAQNTEQKKKRNDSTLVSSIVKAIIYIACILVVSGIMAFFIITRANDAFAFVKSDKTAEITVTEDMTIDELCQTMKDNGIIKYPSIYKLYIKIKGKTTTYAPGVYTVSAKMNYDSLNYTFAGVTSSSRTTVVVTIPEGYTVKQIVNLLVNKYDLSTETELYDAIQNYPFDFWFVKELDEIPATSRYVKDRTYRLEGYLYPDTYYYYSDASAKTIIYKMLDNFQSKLKKTFGNEYENEIKKVCKETGLSFDEMIIIASMIQMEGKYDYDYGGISSVFHNRLNNPSMTYGLLGSDATIQYILEKRSSSLTQAQLEIDNPYNTRVYRGLPPGPISNPTYLSINYAFYPDDTNYYYFVSQANGTTLFGRNYEEHLKNVEIVNSGVIIDTSTNPDEE